MNGKEQIAGREWEFKRNSNAYASLPETATTTKSTKEKRKQRQQQSELQREPERYGLSHSLSSESMKQACDYYDDEPSDEDLIEIQQTPQGFHQQLSKKHQQLQQHPLSFKMQPLSTDDENNAFCDVSQEPPLSTPIKQAAGVPDEALSVLNELDAILDVHGASQLNGTFNSSSSCGNTSSSSDEDKIEDYLMDLDNYLDEQDKDDPLSIGQSHLQRNVARTQTLPLSRKRKTHKKDVAVEDDDQMHPALDDEFQRGHQMRKTFSCGLTPTSTKGKLLMPTSDTQLRMSSAQL